MEIKYKNLFSEGKIGNLNVRNRIVMPPMGTNFANADGSVSQTLIDYYTERACGGVGLIIVEIVCVDSPVGKALVGKREKETVAVRIPKGRVSYKILSIEKV